MTALIVSYLGFLHLADMSVQWSALRRPFLRCTRERWCNHCCCIRNSHADALPKGKVRGMGLLGGGTVTPPLVFISDSEAAGRIPRPSVRRPDMMQWTIRLEPQQLKSKSSPVLFVGLGSV